MLGCVLGIGRRGGILLGAPARHCADEFEPPDHDNDARLSDAALMARIQQGHVNAFTALYLRHRKPVLQFFAARVRDRMAAEDLVQDLFMRILRSADSFDLDRPFTGWLYTLATNLLRDAHRRRSSRPAAVPLTDAVTDTLVGPFGVIADPSDSVLRGLEVASTREAIEKLPPKYREIVLARAYEGASFAAIASRQGVSVPTVRWRMHEAVRRLRLLADWQGHAPRS